MKNKYYIITAVVACIILFLVIFLIILNTNDSNNIENTIKVSSEQSNSTYEYISNNKYNSEFSSYDIEIADEAIYEKYITEEASEKILNQKIYIKIKQITLLEQSDKSTATESKTEYIYSLIDYNNNSWIYAGNLCLEDNSYNIKSQQKDLIIYGNFIGTYNYKEEKYPRIEVFKTIKNLEMIDKEEIQKIGDSFINNLKEAYPNEVFSFSKFEENSKYIELIYKNISEDLEITFIVDDNTIKMAELYVNKVNKKIFDIDQKFVKSFLLCFNSTISNKNVEDYIAGAKETEIEFENKAYNKDYKYKPFSLNNIICETSIGMKTIYVYYN